MVEWLKIADRKKRETAPVTPQIDAEISHFCFHHYGASVSFIEDNLLASNKESSSNDQLVYVPLSASFPGVQQEQ